MSISESTPGRYTRRILSGVRPSGSLHLGNYFGAIRDHLELQDQYLGGTFYFIADLHELTDAGKSDLASATVDATICYLALGLNPERATLYRQSDVPQVPELTWILTCMTPLSRLDRARTAQNSDRESTVAAGRLLYPVLMAADILSMRATDVPVGADQTQHVELARELARRCNSRWEQDVFPVPELRLGSFPNVIGTDGRKMSRVYDNVIPILDSEASIRRAVASVETAPVRMGEPLDSGGVLLSLLELVHPSSDFAALRESLLSGELGFAQAKEILTSDIVEFFAEAREARLNLLSRRAYVEDLLYAGGERARMEAAETLELVRDAVGIAGAPTRLELR